MVMACGLCASTLADFAITPPIMLSAGSLGNAGNSVYLYTYSGPDVVVKGGTFAGTISSIVRGTTIAEARWNIRNTRFGTTGSVSLYHNLGYFENSVLVSGNIGGGMILRTGDVLRIETFEAYDDGIGADAAWNNVAWTFETSTPVSLGRFESVSSILTGGGTGFGTDTEIGLFDSSGALLRWNDDYGGSANSGLAGLSLADGEYFLCVMPYDSTGTNGLVSPGYAGTGPYTLAINGASVDAGTLAPYSNLWYSFTVGEPACPADFNEDGFVDGFDYDDFVACFEGTACPAGTTADFNQDGFADGFDYDDFVSAFEVGCL